VSSRLDVPDRSRLEHEIDLRQRGYVPSPRTTPRSPPTTSCCRSAGSSRSSPTSPLHGRLVWSHPGPSGLDPRAVAPLALVRVADGWGDDRLDPPMDLVQACRWLLNADVAPWLQRRRHRVVLGYATAGCLVEQDEAGLRCLPHPGWAQQLQKIADCLGDVTGTTCWFREAGSVPRTAWCGAVAGRDRFGGRSLRALGATSGLARWSGLRVDGSLAWELARSGMTPPACRTGGEPASPSRRRQCGARGADPRGASDPSEDLIPFTVSEVRRLLSKLIWKHPPPPLRCSAGRSADDVTKPALDDSTTPPAAPHHKCGCSTSRRRGSRKPRG